MSTKKLIQNEGTKLTQDELVAAMLLLQKIIDESERYRNTYFWTPHSSSSSRRNVEFEDSFVINIGNIQIAFESTYRESCSHCYYYKSIMFNGESTTLTKVRNIHDVLGNFLDKNIQ